MNDAAVMPVIISKLCHFVGRSLCGTASYKDIIDAIAALTSISKCNKIRVSANELAERAFNVCLLSCNPADPLHLIVNNNECSIPTALKGRPRLGGTAPLFSLDPRWQSARACPPARETNR